MAFLLSLALAFDEASIGGAISVGRSAGRNDICIEIWGVPELRFDEEAECRGAGSPKAAERRGCTAFAGAEDSFLE